MKLLVVGRSGQVARALTARSSPGVDVVALGRPDIDLQRPESITSQLETVRPDMVAIVGAFTAVDDAEDREDEAFAVNAFGPGRLAKTCAALDAPLAYVSTDYVFDGTKAGPYVEDDATHPIGAYGRSKLAGEIAIREAGGSHLILRTSWVFDAHGKNFVRTMLRLGLTRPSVRVVSDQVGSPTYAGHFADALMGLCSRFSPSRPSGVYHVAGSGVCSWYELALATFEISSELGGPVAQVEAIPSSDYPTKARRPQNSMLSGEKLAGDYGLVLPAWRVGLRECLVEIARDGWKV